MGSNLTKFKKIIESKRDENEAINYYTKNTGFKKKLNVNCSINNNDDTLIHLVCKYGMINLLKYFFKSVFYINKSKKCLNSPKNIFNGKTRKPTSYK